MRKKAKKRVLKIRGKEIPEEVKSIALTFLFAVIAIALVVGLIKITRLGTVGKAYYGTTANVVNLSDYPYPFIDGNVLNTEIIVGDNAPSEDLESAVLINSSLIEAMTPVVPCIDSDEDGYNITGGACGVVDCNDSNASINQGAIEICNDLEDNDCDGLIDCGDEDCITDPVCEVPVITGDSILTGFVILSSELVDLTAQNIIAIGNPCNNTIVDTFLATEGMGCGDWNYTEGQGIIKLFQNGGNLALIVAGTTPEDTQRAAMVLANYDGIYNTKFIGEEVCVEGTDLNPDNFVVNAGPCPEVAEEVLCTDSDGGLNYFVKGTASKEGWDNITDFCVDGIKLSESLCNVDNNPAYAQYDCPAGCENGTCIEAPQVECVDTDSGIDYYTKGSVTVDPGSSESLAEIGLESSDGLVVYSETNATLKLHNEIKNVTLGETYEYSFMTLLISNITYIEAGSELNKIEIVVTEARDHCWDKYLVEMYCNPEKLEVVDDDEYICPAGCLDSVCLPEPQQFNILLNPGWNLISIPLILENNSIENVFADISKDVIDVWTYDPEEEWKVKHFATDAPSNLNTIELGRGYWIEMNNPATLNVEGMLFQTTELETPPSFALKQGWNLVGIYSLENKDMSVAFASIEGKYSALWTYSVDEGDLVKLFSKADPALASADPKLGAGKGYWIYMVQEGDIVP